MTDLLERTDKGLYCRAGDFFVDPWQPVARAIITHAHADHARWGSDAYLCSTAGERVLRERVGADARIRAVPFGETILVDGVKISLHPAGHILGSAQIRIEHQGEVWVVSGDYKTEVDPTCAAFEPVECHTFITESTFGLPVYRWKKQDDVFAEMRNWWRNNAAAGRTSVIFAYALGKAQRVLAALQHEPYGPILIHGALERFQMAYEQEGVKLPRVERTSDAVLRRAKGTALVVAPPSAMASPWMRRFTPSSTAFVSGWMHVRTARRQRTVDAGFALSDHVDWPALQDAIRATRAERVFVTHGYTNTVVRWLSENGYDARALPTYWEGEGIEEKVMDESEAAEGADS